MFKNSQLDYFPIGKKIVASPAKFSNFYSDYYMPGLNNRNANTPTNLLYLPTYSINSPVYISSKMVTENPVSGRSTHFFEPSRTGYQSVLEREHFLPIIKQPQNNTPIRFTRTPYYNSAPALSTPSQPEKSITYPSMYSNPNIKSKISPLPQIYNAAPAIAPSASYVPKYAPSKTCITPYRFLWPK